MMKPLNLVASLGLTILLASPSAYGLVAISSYDREPAAASLEQAEQALAELDEAKDVESYLALRTKQLESAEAGDYGRIQRTDMERLRSSHARMVNLLADRVSANELDPSQKLELFNAQEVIASILQRQNDAAVICERSRATGSNIRSTRCISRAERDRRREAEQDGILRHNHMTPPCIEPSGAQC